MAVGAAHALCAGADRASAPRARRQRDPRLGTGASARRTRAAAHRGSRPAAMSARVRGARSSTTSTGSASSPTCSRPPRFAPDRARDGRSDREAGYRQAIAELAARGLVYGCRCTRREIEAAGDGVASELRYPGTCRPFALPLVDGLSWRLVVEPGAVSVRRRGPWADHPATRRRSAATCCCAIASATGRISSPSPSTTPRRRSTWSCVATICSPRPAGRSCWPACSDAQTPPVFAHHGLVMKSATQKLSKSDGDTGVRELRAAGWTRGTGPGQRRPRRRARRSRPRCGRRRSRRTRRRLAVRPVSDHLPRPGLGVRALGDHRHAVDEHVDDAVRVLMRLLVGGAVGDGGGVEDDQVGGLAGAPGARDRRSRTDRPAATSSCGLPPRATRRAARGRSGRARATVLP